MSDSSNRNKTIQANKDDERLQQSHSARKNNLKTAQKAEIDEAREAHKEQLAVMRDRHTSEIQKEKSIRQQIKENNNKLKSENYRKTAEERTRHEAAMRQQRAQLQEKQSQVREQEHHLHFRKQEEQQKSLKAFNEHMTEQQQSHKAKVEEQKQFHKAVAENDKHQFEDHRKGQREYYEGEIDRESEHFKGKQHERRSEFERAQNEKELNYQLVLEEQKNKYQEQFEKSKYNHIDAVKTYEAPKQDPFYRIQDLGAKMEDKGSHYEVRLQVPEHEIRNFKVHVKDDKITVAGARRFEEELKYEGEKVSTNNYQTMKQEFALGNSVDESAVQKEYKDGFLTVMAPKKGFGIFK